MADDLITGGSTQDNTDAGGTGGGNPGAWFEALPEEVSGIEAAGAWKDKTPGDLLKAHLDAEGKLKTAMIPPGADATPEQKQAFQAQLRQVLGVPEKPEGYALQMPEGIPQGDPIVAALVQQAHAQGLGNAQLNGILGNMVKAIHEHNEAQKLVNMESIKKTWGAEYEKNINIAIRGMEKAGEEAGLDKPTIEALSKQLTYFPEMVRVIAAMGRHYAEDAPPRGGSTAPKTGGRTSGGMPMLDFPSMDKK